MERRFGKPRFDRDRGFGDRRSGGFRDGGFRERRDDFPKPVNEGEEYDIEITEVGTKGDGIARVKNFVIFVPDSKQGEKCRIKIKMVRPKFAVGEKVGKGEEKDVELKEPKKKGKLEVEEPLEEDMEVGKDEEKDVELKEPKKKGKLEVEEPLEEELEEDMELEDEDLGED